MFKHWSERSLRFWITLSMALTLLPLIASIALDHLLVKRGVIAEFQDVANRYRDEVGPAQQLRLDLWEAAVPVNEYLGERDPRQIAEYRANRTQIEGRFASLRDVLRSEPKLVDLLDRARADWSEADRIASDVFSGVIHPTDEHKDELVDKYDGFTTAAGDRLESLAEGLDSDLRQDHDQATISYERAEWITAISAGVALLLMLAGISGFGRVIVGNVERLIEGARRFADGDRKHRIDIQVPPELRKVADEFNKMVERIHESEAALAEEAREDTLTALPNRRAFNESLDAAFARMRRLGERVHLLTLDIDHFKKINDTYGHDVGDEVLRRVAQTLRTNVREVDRAFRVGGEEFAVLVVDTDLTGAQVAAERLRSAVEATRIHTQAMELAVTTSIGMARAHSGMRTEELMKAADTALYNAKSEGRNRIVMAAQTAPSTAP